MAAPAAPALTLLYFNIHGLAARVRLAAAVGGLRGFTDRRFASRDEFAALQQAGELPFGQVPLLLVEAPPEKNVTEESRPTSRAPCLPPSLSPQAA